ncbi:MAG: DUF4437 domain-containing protein [Blastocatellia bacterium]|nr:DUF4437 domain-containing protein [Blastocatellia bacterium]
MKPKILLAILFAIGAPLQQSSTQTAPISTIHNKDRSRYVGFLNEHDLTWRPFEVKGFPPGIQVKLLSRAAKTGATSLLARLPIGWRNAAVGFHASDMEMFVIKGAVKIGNRRLTDRCFTYVPAGVTYGPVAAEKQTTALWFFDGDASFTASMTSKPNAEVNQRVEFKSYYQEPWEAAVEIGFSKQPGIFMKILKRLPNDGPMTWISGSFAGRPPRKYEAHPSAEEAWLLEGEFNLAECLPEGFRIWHMTGGSYFYRPPNIRHIGPNSGSRSYALWLFRTPARLASEYFDDCSAQ